MWLAGRMRGCSSALVVMLVGVALVLAAGVAWASAATSRGGQALPPGTSNAPHQAGLVRGGVVQRPTGCGGFYYGC